VSVAALDESDLDEPDIEESDIALMVVAPCSPSP
jgi:hypothetical protein